MALVDYEGTAHTAFIPPQDLAYFNVLARLRDDGQTVDVLDRLRAAGIAAHDSAFLGCAGDAVHSGTGLTATDEQLIHAVVRDMRVGAADGALAGAALGLAVAWLPPLHASVGVAASVSGFAAAGGLGAIVGMLAGGLIGGEAGLDRSQAGSDTYGDQLAVGVRLVGVHVEDEQRRGAVCELLRACGVLGVRVLAPGEEPTV